MLHAFQYLNSFALGIAVMCGMAAFRYTPRVWGIVGCQLLIALITELFGLYLSSIHQYNSSLYNAYILAEVALLGSFGIGHLRGQMRPAGGLLLLTVMLVNLIFFVGMKPGRFNDIAFLINCIFLTALYLIIILMLQFRGESGLFRQPVLYLCIGTVLYFGCDIPYFSLRTYLIKNNPELGTILHLSINTGLATIRYLLTGFALLLFYMNHRKYHTVVS